MPDGALDEALHGFNLPIAGRALFAATALLLVL
jgi:hypothetical protein